MRKRSRDDQRDTFRCAACDAVTSTTPGFYRALGTVAGETRRRVEPQRFCAAHLRRLVFGDEVPLDTVTRTVDHWLHTMRVRRALTARPGPCVVCTRAVNAATDAASSSRAEVCAAHLEVVAYDGRARTVGLGRRLRDLSSWQEERRALAPGDPVDTAIRAELRASVPTAGAECAAPTALDGLRLRLEAWSCAICIEIGRVEARWLGFVAAELRRGRSPLSRPCAGHVDDLVALSPALGEQLIDQLVATIARDIDRLASKPRFRGVDGPSESRCEICHALEATAFRQAALLRLALRDARWRATYERSHGLCLHHLSELELASNRFLARQARKRVRSVTRRLAACPDREAALEALSLLDGRALLGATAPSVLEPAASGRTVQEST